MAHTLTFYPLRTRTLYESPSSARIFSPLARADAKSPTM
jgi:hypothetical protein